MTTDPYAHLSRLCGIAAFSLPPRPLLLPLPPPPRPPADHFGPIPPHLLSRYLCYDTPSPQLFPSSSIPYSSPATATHPSPGPLPLHPPSFCPDFTASLSDVASPRFSPHRDSVSAISPPSEALIYEPLISCNRDSPRRMDSPVHRREILPPCVVNYQGTLCFTPEREPASLGVGVSDDEIRIPCLSPPSEMNETASYLVSVVKKDAFTGWYGKRLPSLIKRLALWRKDVILDDKECEKIASFVRSSFSSRGRENSLQEAESRSGRENSLQEASTKKRRKQEAKSKGVASSFYFTRSKSAKKLPRS